MKDDSLLVEPAATGRGRTLTGILAEALVLAVLGGSLALVANAISPAGLSLTRDYFPAATNSMPVPPAAAVTPPASATNGGTVPAVAAPAVKYNAKGLQLLDGGQASALFGDPRRQLDLVVFVDARNDEHYAEGHVPGAFHFDPYRPEKEIATVLPVCRAAEQIVVYCTGGDCEDSETAAVFLRNAGIPNDRLFVYSGGITEWTTNNLPLETGARNSGTLRPAKR